MSTSRSPSASPLLTHRTLRLNSSGSNSSSSGSGQGRGRPTSALQTRRATAHGLGVSFASLALDDNSSGPSSPAPGSSSARPASSASRSQSRRSSIQSNPTSSTSRQSISHLASFLAGVEHHTRVRSPGLGGGRGVSRSQSRAGDDRSDSITFGRLSRQSSQQSQSRTASGSGTPTSGIPLKRETTDNPLAIAERARHDSPKPVLEALQQRFHPPATPRLPLSESGEEPFIESTPSSPQHRAILTPLEAAEVSLHGVDVFQVGERVGVGVYLEGRGGWARDCFADSPPPDTAAAQNFGVPGELEVVRKLGEGTYAVVYLVREVLYDPDPADEDLLTPLDPEEWNVSSRPAGPKRSWTSDPFSLPTSPTYGRNFALKCLCKQDLTAELIEVQRGEAHLHRALPDHENIVRLFAAYETDDWLFLVLEYCPGQDLFYWLDERQDDHEVLYDLHSRAASPFQSYSSPRRSFDAGANVAEEDDPSLSRTLTAKTTFGSLTSASDFDQTPPSPTLLSRKEDANLLTRKRLRLISRMFAQMCSAVQACHDKGISHRDIKPENFIVSDGRGMADSGAGRVVVKITDWGLGTRETECEDFDCGSKPYMAYECRNNLRPTYDPRQADVWSLGLVLLNLLYHRNPWADPSLDDPDFAEYMQDPRGFLQDRFEGIGEDVSGFLADRVFCDVLEHDESGEPVRRVSAGEFGKWAGRLVTMMAESKRKMSATAEPVAQTLTFTSVNRVASPLRSPQRPQASLLSQFAPSDASTTAAVAAEPRLPKVEEVVESAHAADSLSSTSAAMSSNLSKSPADMFPCDEDNDDLPSPSFPPTSSSIFQTLSASRLVADEPMTAAVSAVETSNGARSGSKDSGSASGESKERNGQSDDEDGELKCYSPSEATSRAKRRKRGARRGRSNRTPGGNGELSPASPGSPRMLPTVDEQRDLVLADLASASQELAREISKTTKRTQPERSSSTPASPLRPSLAKPPLTSVSTSGAKANGSSGGMLSRMRNLVKDGNPDLQAFKARVEERNASLGVTSAPAKMQNRNEVTSRGSVGTSSWGSWTGGSVDGANNITTDDRGRSHWSSTTSRRERLDKQHHKSTSRPNGHSTVSVDASSPPSTRIGGSSTSFESRSSLTTPMSSFSSVASSTMSAAVLPSKPNGAADRTWRRSEVDSAATTKKPKLKDAVVDTTDLEADANASHVTIRPPAAATHTTASSPITASPSKGRPSSSAGRSTEEAASTQQAPPQAKNKLAKMLNSISMFNRSQDSRPLSPSSG